MFLLCCGMVCFKGANQVQKYEINSGFVFYIQEGIRLFELYALIKLVCAEIKQLCAVLYFIKRTSVIGTSEPRYCNQNVNKCLIHVWVPIYVVFERCLWILTQLGHEVGNDIQRCRQYLLPFRLSYFLLCLAPQIQQTFPVVSPLLLAVAFKYCFQELEVEGPSPT